MASGGLRAGQQNLNVSIEGDLVLPPGATGVVVFAHGSGSGRHSPRNRFVAERLHAHGLGTLLVDLVTEAEEADERRGASLRFDIPFLAQRLEAAAASLERNRDTSALALGLFGASTGAAAALALAGRRPERVRAVVSRGGRPDLTPGELLGAVRAPTLLIVGGADEPVVGLNRKALARLDAPTELEIVPGATHLFEEPGALERVADLAAAWFLRHLPAPRQPPRRRPARDRRHSRGSSSARPMDSGGRSDASSPP